MSAEQNKDLAFRGLDAINRHDVAGLDAIALDAVTADAHVSCLAFCWVGIGRS